ncbi:MAG: hypothetical protein EOM17_12990 [Synergistales bacterium]|nr:hypothetical protein [Synergistales bacterium]
MAMTHRQRVENALALQETDRIPYSMWMHFPNRDRHPRRLAELSLANQKKYDLDFIKFMPYGMYSTIDYGIDLDLFPGFVDAPVAHKPFIENIEDWDKIRFVSGTSGEYAVVLEAQRLLFGMMNERIPFLQTVFSPMTTAAKLCSPAVLMKHIAEDPCRVRRALGQTGPVASGRWRRSSVRASPGPGRGRGRDRSPAQGDGFHGHSRSGRDRHGGRTPYRHRQRPPARSPGRGRGGRAGAARTDGGKRRHGHSCGCGRESGRAAGHQ